MKLLVNEQETYELSIAEGEFFADLDELIEDGKAKPTNDAAQRGFGYRRIERAKAKAAKKAEREAKKAAKEAASETPEQ